MAAESIGYEDLAGDAAELIALFADGATMTLRRAGAADRECVAVEHYYSQRERDGNLVLINDRRFLVSPDIATPPDSEEDQLVDFDGTVLQIVKVDRLRPSPGGPVLLYTLQVR